MEIGLFTDTLLPVVDGVGRVVLAYAENLPKLGAKTVVSAPLNHFGNRGGLPFDLIDYTSINIPKIKQYKAGTPVLDLHYSRRIKRANLDIAHAHSPFVAGQESLRIAKAKGIPLIGTFHSKYYDDFYKATHSETLSQALTSAVVSFYEKCDEVWAVSHSTAKVLKSYGFTGDIQVMPNGVEIRSLDPKKIDEAEKKFNIGEKPLLLFVGQMDLKKNILLVLKSVALLKKQGVQFTLMLAGQGPDAKKIEEHIAELDIADCAKLIGHITDSALLDALYSRASLFVFPSVYDNAPMVLREAAVMKTPSVLMKGSDASEIIKDRENGFLCENNEERLCAVIKEALSNPDKTAEIGIRASQSIPVSWSEVLTMALERYEALAKRTDTKYRK
ncbi:MAG: glycosyltransferase [Eubacteriales bacterium]|nr:glycosyltransferase [Eubacteriales bacterium]